MDIGVVARGRANRWFAAAVGVIALAGNAIGQAPPPLVPGILTAPPEARYGPFNVKVLQGGIGLAKPLHPHEPLAAAQRDWAMALWLKTDETALTTLLAGIGRPGETSPRYLALRDGRAVFWAGGATELTGGRPLETGVWHAIQVVVDAAGTAHLRVDAAEVATAAVPLGPASPVLEIAPTDAAAFRGFRHFGGWLAQVALQTQPPATASGRIDSAPLDNLPFEEASKPWPVQTRGQAGMRAPQDPSILPHSAAPAQPGTAVAPLAGTDEAAPDGALTLRRGWQLRDAAEVSAPGDKIASAAFDASGWIAATVPGTVLTTLIDRGIYPDPDYGLNNMAIPESLSRRSFWYRETFTPPATMRGRNLRLTFHGINYRATVWVNGHPAGEIVGAFRHKGFDVTASVKPGERNYLAVRIDPPPHGGIAHEQSLAAGSGDNGGMMMLDGPTFGATEGWDWIPAIRDRNMGIWQDVVLSAAGPVSVDVPRIVTKLPLPERDRASITVRVPLANATAAAVRGVVEIAFDGVHASKPALVPPGGATVDFTPNEFPQLLIEHPRLWWPNGYGAPELHRMTLTFKAGGRLSDTRVERFGIREITYEVSAFDAAGHLQRLEVSPAAALLAGQPAPIAQTHEAFRQTPEGWVTSIAAGMEGSAALKTIRGSRVGTALAIRVNGVRIAVKGGAWGMDDIRKRVARERMEPFFRLHKEANVNMIRNWMGQDTEDVFYDLADEYGMLVWNDFWASTQDWNLEPSDAGLFLDNARDTIVRYRNHPSIAVWCGRNEGVPPPTINEGLARLTTVEDGTRYYSADSNKINLHDSGPYKYQEPEDYFTRLSLGFAVEVGLASPPTREVFEAWMPAEDRWPVSDDWAYHDWHQAGNGDVAPYMSTMIEEFGAPASLADFDRKAQMLNYESHRAVFEGFNAHLWAPNTGRLLWMTQPAWPSSVWQIFSHDYDTHGSFYGVKKAAEPVHIQMNLPAHDVAVVNNTEQPLAGVQAAAHVFDLTGKLLFEKNVTLTAAPNAVSGAFGMELQAAMESAGVVLVKLDLKDAAGKPLSDNLYWQSATKAGLRAMSAMAPATVTATASPAPPNGTERHLSVKLVNTGTAPALAAKLTLLDAVTGLRVLPAYYSDNYVSLLPGETRLVDIAFPGHAGAVKIGLRGWNIPETAIALP